MFLWPTTLQIQDKEKKQTQWKLVLPWNVPDKPIGVTLLLIPSY